ncbi:gastrin/cholecystokinin type B receptor-like [Haliotis cracherodii]|uniref:gastrin/cholecystokinin type B receptor-like n=1 Tax=Haliotis cracherodii TaxID=6455 RepID=UPI0039ED7329
MSIKNHSSAPVSIDDLNDEFAMEVLPVILFLCLIMVMGICGNVLVLFVYCGRNASVTRRFILALTAVDLINCVLNTPADIADIRYKYTFGSSFVCPATRFGIAFSCIASCSLLVAIAIERYQKICKPFRKQTAPLTAMVAILICFVSAACFAIPAGVLNGEKDVKISGFNGSDCGIKNEFRDTDLPKVFNGILFILFFCACVVVIVMYILIWKRLRVQNAWKASRGTHGLSRDTTERVNQSEEVRTSDVSMGGNSGTTLQPETATAPTSCSTQGPDRRLHHPTQTSSSSVDRTTLMMFFVTILFIVSFLPYITITTASAVDRTLFKGLSGATLAFYTLAVRSYFLSSALNPVVYSICSSGFRTYLKKRTKELVCINRQ